MQKKHERRAKRHGIQLLRAQASADRAQRGKLPDLTENQVLAWADAFFARTGSWPRTKSGAIPESPGETWRDVEVALLLGIRGFPRGGSLGRFFAKHRGRNSRPDQHFSISQILAWADAWQARTGRLPMTESGEIPGTGGLSWSILNSALRDGRGGLTGGSSLHRLLTGKRRALSRTSLTVEQILVWADAHHARTGEWPHAYSGRVLDAHDETWIGVSNALARGTRGLPGGTSLIKLLVNERGVRSRFHTPRLTVSLILGWADAFHARVGRWPRVKSGPVAEIPGETWARINSALIYGSRGLSGGSSLARLLACDRGVRNQGDLPSLTVSEIARWADLYHNRHGTWPDSTSGPIPEVPGETWKRVQVALQRGARGLPEGWSLKRLLWEQRGARYALARVPFTVDDILAWADAHQAQTGKWPTAGTGPILECPGTAWRAVDTALKDGGRGLPGGSSLSRLLAERRTVRRQFHSPDLTITQILAWAKAFEARTGQWPKQGSGRIAEADGQTWYGMWCALRAGKRGLPHGLSLRGLRDLAKRDELGEASGTPQIGETGSPGDPAPSEPTIPLAATARRIGSRKRSRNRTHLSSSQATGG